MKTLSIHKLQRGQKHPHLLTNPPLLVTHPFLDFFEVRSFIKHLLWHQNYFGMDYSPPLSPLFNILKTLYPPSICKWREGDSIYAILTKDCWKIDIELFPVVRCFTRKLEFVSSTLWMVVSANSFFLLTCPGPFQI